MSAHLMLLLLQDAFMRDWSKLLSKFYIVRLFFCLPLLLLWICSGNDQQGECPWYWWWWRCWVV